MKFLCRFTHTDDGRWLAKHEGGDIGKVQVIAASREEAIEKLCEEIRYRLELCPCSGESYQHIQVEIASN